MSSSCQPELTCRAAKQEGGEPRPTMYTHSWFQGSRGRRIRVQPLRYIITVYLGFHNSNHYSAQTTAGWTCHYPGNEQGS